MNNKIDYAPLLRQIVEDKHQKPADVVKIINSVAPGAVSRRAVDFWLADRASNDSRPCDSKWIALLCYGMHVQGKINSAEQRNVIKVMNEMDKAADQKRSGSSQLSMKVVKGLKGASSGRVRISPFALNLFDQSMRSVELRQMRRSSSQSPSVQAIRKMKLNIVGL